MQGHRREDQEFGEIPENPQPGDFWKYLIEGEPLKSDSPSNLTGTIWGFRAPRCGIGTLRHHTVREHEDGTISVRPGDGSSNSILISTRDENWHGYIEHGDWQEV